ncbi:[F-actin]-monooxygenase mical1 [Dissostichus eleginoides]|uniref:F-actin monooxygenase n=1 Tax=Dissostichus eleginoides TaxID=100907 RepID=A0AAD9FEJ8_DISEL|nr:[F-actin]-monooxygenase mical1 [Dissostichus eleginoides]
MLCLVVTPTKTTTFPHFLIVICPVCLSLSQCLVLGAGPCGLRTAIELALLGAQVLVLEKRESFSRNNVLHLWPYTICDLRSLGAKKFYGKFCTGSLDHISIRQLQLILLKVSLLLGVEVHTGVEFQSLIEPSGDNGWMAKLQPGSHPASTFEFDVFISAGGGRFVPDGFRHKELRGKLAIGITTNFINRHTAEEAQVAEISGVARIYNQKFFQELLTEMGIDLENIVYYKDATHYFVMTAKKQSLLKKGVIKQDFSDAEELLAPANVDEEALRCYAYDAASFSTGGKLPDLQFAPNHAGKPDVAMFDFTCMQRAENASQVREKRGKKLLMALVGDCLVEPFWPLGTGIARGFLASFDTAWMVRSWGLGTPHLKVLAERESIYQVLSQTTPENCRKNYVSYSIDPKTRYMRVNLSSIQAHQVQHLYIVDKSNPASKKQKNRFSYLRQDSVSGFEELLKWCQKNTAGYKNVDVKDFTQSWRSGMALCALIHHFGPQLIDMSALDESSAVHNNQLAFSILEKELGIPPVMAASDLANSGQIDKLSMVLYLTQVQKAFALPAKDPAAFPSPAKPLSLSTTQSAVFFLNKLKHNSLQRRKEKLASLKKERDTTMEEEDSTVVLPVSPERGRFYCELHSEELELQNGAETSCKDSEGITKQPMKTTGSPVMIIPPLHQMRKAAAAAPTEEETVRHPVPKPRKSQLPPSPQPSPPVAKPRTVHIFNPSTPERQSSPTPTEEISKAAPDSRPKQRKLKISDEEKSQLVNLQSLSVDSDSETPGGSSSCSSSSATAGGTSPPKPEDGQEEEGYWSGSTASHMREKRHRRCFRRKEMPGGQARVRSKFSPWNLSSPRISRDARLSVLVNRPGRVETTFRHIADAASRPCSGREDGRLRKAQSIQRRLEEIEVTFKELEDKGVVLERTLRGEAGSNGSPDMIEHWIQLVHEKNSLVTEESDLMVASRQLELEDKQSTLELELRKYMEMNDKTPEQQSEEERVLQQMLDVVDMRDSLVSFLEEKRLTEIGEEQEAFSIMEAKRHSKAGAQVHWA